MKNDRAAERRLGRAGRWVLSAAGGLVGGDSRGGTHHSHLENIRNDKAMC